MAALRLRLQKEMFDVTEEQLLALAHVTNSQVTPWKILGKDQYFNSN